MGMCIHGNQCPLRRSCLRVPLVLKAGADELGERLQAETIEKEALERVRPIQCHFISVRVKMWRFFSLPRAGVPRLLVLLARCEFFRSY